MFTGQKLNFVKMPILPEFIYRLNTIPVKIPEAFCRKEEVDSKFNNGNSRALK